MSWIKLAAKILLAGSLVSMAIVAIYGCWNIVMTSPYFHLAQIRLVGNDRVSRNEILAAAAIREGENIFCIDVNEVGRKIEEIPWVKEVSLKREFPDTLTIKLVERSPTAMIYLGDFYYIDDEGYIFARADSRKGYNYPILTGIDKGSLLDEDDNAFDLLARGLELVQLLRTREGMLSWEDISEIALDDTNGATLYPVNQGIPIRLGKSGFAGKLKRSERVLLDLEEKNARASLIEADFDDRVLVRLGV